jgi:hypothetical protein
MRFANRALSVGGLLLTVTGLAACGTSGSLLSANQARELKGQLTQVSQSLSARQCQQAANQITNFRSTVDGLNSVDQNLVANLDQGASRLSQLAGRECPAQTVHHTVAPKTTPAPSTPTQTTTATTPPPSTPTQTATTPTTPTQTTTTQTTPTGPGSGGAGLPGGNGNGNGQAKDNGPGSGGAGS